MAKDQPAFPIVIGNKAESIGMFMREYYAAMALQGMFSNRWTYGMPPDEMAKRAFAAADAMIDFNQKGESL